MTVKTNKKKIKKYYNGIWTIYRSPRKKKEKVNEIGIIYNP